MDADEGVAEVGVAVDMDGRVGLNIGGERVGRADIVDPWVTVFVSSSDPWWGEEEGSETDLRGGGTCA